jgi:PKD repeat protein
LIANPSVGDEPLEVVLDASFTELNDPNDEIIYFTWDFGDGSKILKNYSE